MKTVMEPSSREQALVSRAQSGDRKAFEELLEGHRCSLEKYARMRIGSHLRAKVEVEDVLQETCARAFQSIGHFHWKNEKSFLVWIKGIAEHVILKLAERHQRDQVLYVEEETISPEASPSRVLRRGERFDRLQAALDGLRPDHKEVSSSPV